MKNSKEPASVSINRILLPISLGVNIILAIFSGYSSIQKSKLENERDKMENEKAQIEQQLYMEKNIPRLSTFYSIAKIEVFSSFLKSKQQFPYGQHIEKYAMLETQQLEDLSRDLKILETGDKISGTVHFLIVMNPGEVNAYNTQLTNFKGDITNIGFVESHSALLVPIYYKRSANQETLITPVFSSIDYVSKVGRSEQHYRDTIANPVNPSWTPTLGGEIRGWGRATIKEDDSYLENLIPSSKMRAKLIIGLAIIMTCKSVMGVTYLNLPVNAYGIKDSRLTLTIQNEFILPSLSSYALNNDVVKELVSSQPSNAAAMRKVILDQPGLSLGHAMPYIYLAINEALGRVYLCNFKGVPPDIDTISKNLDLKYNYEADGTKNMQDFISIHEVKNQHLKVEIYSDLKSLRKAQQNLNYVSEGGFWDPKTSRIGIFLNLKTFYWVPTKVNTSQVTKEKIVALRNYIFSKIFQTIGHEVLHFFQYASNSKNYKNSFLAEAAANYVQDIIGQMDDLSKVELNSYALNIPTYDPFVLSKIGMDFMNTKFPLSGPGIAKIKRGIKAITDNPQLNLKNLVFMEEGEFYYRDPKELEKLYNISLAFSLFVADIPRDRFIPYFDAMLNPDKESSKKSLIGLNREFNTWKNNFNTEWGNLKGEQSSFSFEDIQDHVLYCIVRKEFLAAAVGANKLMGIRPNSVVGWLYTAIIFTNLSDPLSALDYYAKAYDIGKKNGFENSNYEFKIRAGLADCYEAIGDLKEALTLYETLCADMKFEKEFDNLIDVSRIKLKKIFYQKVLSDTEQYRPELISILEGYTLVVQLRPCPTEIEYRYQREVVEAFSKGLGSEVKIKYQQLFDEVSQRMLTEISKKNLDEILLENEMGCLKLVGRPNNFDLFIEAWQNLTAIKE